MTIRKLICPALALGLLCVLACGAALAEPGPLSVEELHAFEARLRATDNGFFTSEQEGGGYVLRWKDFAVYTDRPSLSADAVISRVTLYAEPEEDDLSPLTFRGLTPGLSLKEALNAFPLTNPLLRGTREEAGLYLTGSVPGTGAAGVLRRNGQSARRILHRLFETSPAGVRVYTVEIVLSWDTVDSIDVYLSPDVLTLEDARSVFDSCADLMATDEYAAWLPASGSADAAPFNRDDLVFSGLDFLTLTPQDAENVLGGRYEEDWVRDGVNWLHTMRWPGLSVTFVHGEDREALFADSLFLSQDVLEGPRGLMPGAALDDILARFYYAATDVSGDEYDIYHAGAREYGRLSKPEAHLAQVRYVCQAEGRTVMLRLDTENNRLTQLTLQLVRD